MKIRKILVVVLLSALVLIAIVMLITNMTLFIQSLVWIIGGLLLSAVMFISAYDMDLHKTVFMVGFVPIPGVIFCLIPAILSIVFVVNTWSNDGFSYDYKNTNKTEFAVTSYHGSNEHIIIPDEYKGSKVTAIWHGAFQNNKHIRSIVLPINIEAIELDAFSGCDNLTEIYIHSKRFHIFDSTIIFSDDMLSNITIYSHAGSSIESYARNKGIKFRLLDGVLNIDFQEIKNDINENPANDELFEEIHDSIATVKVAEKIED